MMDHHNNKLTLELCGNPKVDVLTQIMKVEFNVVKGNYNDVKIFDENELRLLVSYVIEKGWVSHNCSF